MFTTLQQDGEDDVELQNITSSVCEFAVSICGSTKVSTALRSTVLKSSQHSSLRAKVQSVTWQWIGDERALAVHIKLTDHFSKIIDDGVVKLGKHQKTLERSFIEQAQKHHRYLEQI